MCISPHTRSLLLDVHIQLSVITPLVKMSTVDVVISASSASSSSLSLEKRLAEIQKALRKATQESMASERMLDDSSKDASTTTTTTSSPRGVQEESSSSSNSSFHLGMDLFGPDPAIVERQLREKLDELEGELQRVLILSGRHTSTSIGTTNAATTTSNDEPPQDSEKDETDQHHYYMYLTRQIEEQKQQIQILKQASLVRSALDEAATLSSPALSAEINLVHASQHLVQAQEWLGQLQVLLDDNASLNKKNTKMIYGELQSSLKQALRRQRLDLLHKANTLLDASFTMPTSMTNLQAQQQQQLLQVKSSPALVQALTVLETLSDKNSGSATTTNMLSLQDALHRFTRRLQDGILQPLLEPLLTATPTQLGPLQVSSRQQDPSKRMLASTTSGITSSSSSSTSSTLYTLEWHRSNIDNNTHTKDSSSAVLEWPMGVWKNTLEAVQQILLFCVDHMWLQREFCSAWFRTKLFGSPHALPTSLQLQALGLESKLLLGRDGDTGGFMQPLVKALERTCLTLPQDNDDTTTTTTTTKSLPDALEKRQEELRAILQPFCQALYDSHLLEHATQNQLMDFCETLPEKYVQHQKCRVLNQARDILRHQDYHNTTTVGKPPPPIHQDDDVDGAALFVIPYSSISVVAWNLLTLLKSTMVDSTQAPPQPPTLRPALYQASREMLSLFRAIIPSLYGSEIATIPRTAAIFHNDCVYLAHACMTLGVEFQQAYVAEDARGKLLQQSCIFVDQVPLFRELGQQALQDVLQVQQGTLVELVGERIGYLGQALASHEPVQEWSDAEKALTAGLYDLRHLAKSWRPPLLERAIFGKSMGHLADVILALYWKQVESARTMTPPARHFMLGLFRQAGQELEELILQKEQPDMTSIIRGGRPSPRNGEKEQAYLRECCTEWGRFQALIRFLDMGHLDQVETALSSGIFRHLTVPALTHLVHIAHPESRARQGLLQQLDSV